MTCNAETITFKNFDKEIILEKSEHSYVIKESNQHVTLANRLIVKTSHKYSKKKLAKADKQINNVTELYQGKDFNYYAVDLESNANLQEVMDSLSKKKSILLVQSDILQATEKSHESKEHNENPLSKSLKKPQNKLQQQLNREKQLVNALPRYLNFIGVKELWEKTKGKGIKIAVIDDGFDLKHDEFKNTKLSFSYDATEQSLNSQPKESIDTHGTKIAGVIFANHDKKGVEGIAPEAELIAIRQPDTSTSKTLLSFQIANLSKADIINCSWNSPQLMQPIEDVVNDLAKNGREGKGTAVIFAAGNKGIEITTNSTEASIDSAIVVGASNLIGKKPLKFSNKGASVDLLSFGMPIQTTLPDNKYGTFAATSLAASITSGVCALLLSQNPELTLQQLQSELKKALENNKRMKLRNQQR
jgi:subtilisin family serine protease